MKALPFTGFLGLAAAVILALSAGCSHNLGPIVGKWGASNPANPIQSIQFSPDSTFEETSANNGDMPAGVPVSGKYSVSGDDLWLTPLAIGPSSKPVWTFPGSAIKTVRMKYKIESDTLTLTTTSGQKTTLTRKI